MIPQQYEIWIADLNPRIGTEPGKIRPVLILQTNLLNKVHPSTLICPITTNVISESDILRIHLPKGTYGLNESSDIMVDQIRAIDNVRLVKKTGKIPLPIIEKLKENIKIIFDLE